MKNKAIEIEYYSDILCIWAWVAQRRIDELNKRLGDKVFIKHHYVDIFGDVPSKMEKSWKERGGYLGYAEHVQQSVLRFEGVRVNPKIWLETRPKTSANVHLVLKAIELLYGQAQQVHMAFKFRKYFFVEAFDLGNMNVLLSLVEKEGLKIDKIKQVLDDGSAIALLMNDYQMSKDQNIKGSPSYVMDGGRQTLYGNVSFQILFANIEELLKTSNDSASWC